MKNANINKLDWDSNFFGQNIGLLLLDGEDLILIDEDSYDLIVTNQTEDFLVNLPEYAESFKETKVLFHKTLTESDRLFHADIKDSDDGIIDFKFFQHLAYESGKMSRFRLDSKFGEIKFKQLYDLWIINSLNKKFAVKVFFIEKENRAIGFITLQEQNGIGKIGLIATHPNFQGQGIGRKLLEHAQDYCMKKNIKNLEIPTQKENTNACFFYLKMGYLVKEMTVVKHFWRKNDY